MQEPYLNGLSVLFHQKEPDHYGNAGLDMSTSMVILEGALKLLKRIAEVYPTGMPFIYIL